MNVKLQIARAQLGTALSLFIRDKDPLSVHALACGGGEIVEGLAEQAGFETLSTHILKTIPEGDYKKVKRIRNQYWNAIKHFYDRDGKTARDDEALMASFTDEQNDAYLFMGWLDYLLVAKRLPVEMQVFQFGGMHPTRMPLHPEADPTPWRTLLPRIEHAERAEKKRRLRRAIENYRTKREILTDPRTQVGRLMPSL